MARKLRVAWFSPLAPAGSKGAYVSRMLIPLLEKWCAIDLFHDSITQFEGRAVAPFLSAFDRHARIPYDIFFYQLEDGRHSYFSRVHLGLIPGVVWMHDFFLSDYGPEPILNSAWQETVKKFRERNHPWCAHDMKHKPKGPHAHREAALAGVKIFSSERDHSEYRRSIEVSLLPTTARSYYIPLPGTFPKSLTSNLNDNSSEVRIAFCGAPRIEDRAESLLHAIERTQGSGNTSVHLTWLIDSSERGEAEALMSDAGLSDSEIKKVTIVEGRTPERWYELVAHSTLAVHTRFSVFGQLGPYLNISLAAGIPSVVCNFGHGELLPSSLLCKISCGSGATRELSEIIAAAHQLKTSRGTSIANFGVEMYQTEVIAGEVMSVFEASRPALASLAGRWKAFEGEAKVALSLEAKSHFASDLFGSAAIDQAYRELGWG